MGETILFLVAFIFFIALLLYVLSLFHDINRVKFFTNKKCNICGSKESLINVYADYSLNGYKVDIKCKKCNSYKERDLPPLNVFSLKHVKVIYRWANNNGIEINLPSEAEEYIKEAKSERD